MRRLLGVIIVLLLVSAGTGAAKAMDTQSPPPTRSSTCVKLTVTSTLRTTLRTVHDRVTARTFAGPTIKSTYYGRCGITYYATTSFLHTGVGYTDQPQVFKRRLGQRWRDEGDTGGNLCESQKVPQALLRVWKIDCT